MSGFCVSRDGSCDKLVTSFVNYFLLKVPIVVGLKFFGNLVLVFVVSVVVCYTFVDSWEREVVV